MMGDSCICMDVHEDGYYHLKEKVVKARMPHVCGECGCQIKPGDRYETASIVFDGGIETHATCIPCMNMRNDLFSCGWYYGQIWENLVYHFDDVLPDLEDDEDDDYKWLKG